MLDRCDHRPDQVRKWNGHRVCECWLAWRRRDPAAAEASIRQTEEEFARRRQANKEN